MVSSWIEVSVLRRSDRFVVLMKEKLVVGLSGGRDSVALTHYLYAQREYDLVLAHMNFHLRGEESERDERFVRRLARELFPKSELVVKGVNCAGYASAHKVSVEMAARELRYAWFEELRRKYGATYIAVAHHADDQIETVLMNLARGTGGAGLVGMKERDDGRHLIRPFLSMARTEINAYVTDFGLPYVDDSTNTDEEIRRNYIRYTLIPTFESLNPSFRKSFLRSIGIFSEEQAYIESVVDEEEKARFDRDTDSIKLEDSAEQMPELIFRRLFARRGFNDEQIRSLRELGGKSARKFHLASSKISAQSFRGRLYMYEDPLPLEPYRLPVSRGQTDYDVPHFGGVRMDTGDSLRTGRGLLRVDAGCLSHALCLRNAEPDDRFSPFGMKRGSKLLFDYLKERGVPPVYRPFCPVVASEESGEVVAVLPFEIAETAKVTGSSCETLTLSLFRPDSTLARLLIKRSR